MKMKKSTKDVGSEVGSDGVCEIKQRIAKIEMN